MTDIPTILLIGLLVEAIALGLVMRRRGFDGYVWLIIGLFLGPIAVAVAIARARRWPHRAPSVVVGAGQADGGSLDVLVGYDGSAESTEAAVRVHDLFDGSVGRL